MFEIDKAGSAPPHDKRSNRITRGLVASSVLHALVALLFFFGLPHFTTQPELIVPINLVELGEKTASPPSQELAPLPQERARETAHADPTQQATPAPQPLPPQAVLHQPEKPVPAPSKGPKLTTAPVSKAPQQQLPSDSLSARLRQLALLRQPTPPLPPSPRQQSGSRTANETAASADSATAFDATYGVKDFIRAQVERRWNLNGNMVKGHDWVVAIHIVLKPDGRISQADIVDSLLYHSDAAYRDFALSARNAVLLSSPLTLPPGKYDLAKDIVVDFSSKQVLR